VRDCGLISFIIHLSGPK